MTTTLITGLRTVCDFELKFLSDLRSAVSVDSYEAVLKAAAMIPLYNVPGTLYTLAQLLSYVTHVAKFFTEVSKETTAKFENKCSSDEELANENEAPPSRFCSCSR